ncbi:hypothetical protein J437_LFUL005432 [Ladona fulva]|uniref:Uncharacterized protein n=1 Tax=Ladona fulva TaxID=123851 RepID=A0A8K0JWV4_LADFU|nr:hypothetical protein J437_LFUL005432 [Ladona fulva]
MRNKKRSLQLSALIISAVLTVTSSDFTAASTVCIKDCAVSLGPRANPRVPLLISKSRGYLIPVNSRSIVVFDGESIQVICPGNNNQIVGKKSNEINAICKCDGLFEYPKFVPFTLNCTQPLTETVLETNEKCGSFSDSNIVKIGWSLKEENFLTQIEICFSKSRLLAEYSRHTLRGSGVYYRDRDSRRRSFKVDKYFLHQKPPISRTYSKVIQQDTLTNLLGDKRITEKYIGGWGSTSYLVRGHLTPDADFSLQTWQDATYHHLNVVPQWMAFNNGNWKVLEGAIRVKAMRPFARNLTIYTGTYGILNLPDVNNNEVAVYLLEGQKLPVPEYVWKVVIDEENSEAVGFVLVNKPASCSPSKEKPLCNDICHNIMWVTWSSRTDSRKGIIYCCSLNSLRKIIPSLPLIPKVKLLEN